MIKEEKHIEILVLDLDKFNLDVSEWEEDVKPIKVILSLVFPKIKGYGEMSEIADTRCIANSILSCNMNFTIQCMALIMENGTIRVCD